MDSNTVASRDLYREAHAAFALLWSRHAAYVRNLAAKRVREWQGGYAVPWMRSTSPRHSEPWLAEEVAQEVFAALWKQLLEGDSLPDEEAERRWLSLVTRRTAGRAVKTDRRGNPVSLEVVLEDETRANTLRSSAPPQLLTYKLKEVLLRMPERERSALIDAALGETHEDTAEALGTTIEGSRALRMRARQRAEREFAA